MCVKKNYLSEQVCYIQNKSSNYFVHLDLPKVLLFIYRHNTLENYNRVDSHINEITVKEKDKDFKKTEKSKL